MNLSEIYKSKLISASEAVKHIKSEDRVVIAHAVGEPKDLVKAMVNNHENYHNVEIVHMVALGPGEYTNSEMKDHFRHNALFIGASTRKAVNERRADFTPCFFSEAPRLFKEGHMPIDVVMLQVSKPDEHGYCSFGTSCDYTKPATENAKLIIAEVNENMPRTFGDNFIHIKDMDYLVETNYPLVELKPSKISDVEKAIGMNCAKLIEDGSTLQLGIGSIPDAVLMFLKDKKDLGIHSEMISDGVVDLYNEGVITNKRKTLHKDKMIVTFLMGTKKLYDFVDNNPEVELYPVDYVNDPKVIMQNYKMVSINSCIQVDLMGQVVSETIGTKQFSGVGGQVDYVRGASMSEGGKSILAMPSTAAKGKISRIVSCLDKGAAVTTTRNDVQYIVTEYGIADLRGKSLRERAELLINIAHPNFREQLRKEYNELI